jgi:hypothetical protein
MERDVIETNFPHSQFEIVRKTLECAGFAFNPNLVYESISFYNSLIYITDNFDNFDPNKDKTMIISHNLKEWCFWEV